MANTIRVEKVTSLDLLMPRTYVGALLAFRSTESITPVATRLQHGLAKLCKQLPWLSGHVFPSSTRNDKPGLDIRWDDDLAVPSIVDKGTIEIPYEGLAHDGFHASAIPANIWPVPNMIDDASFTAGIPVFEASLFRFSDHLGLGLCVSIHHNVVDASGFFEVLKLWVQHLKEAGEYQEGRLGMDREGRMHHALSSHLQNVSPGDLITSHPELSRNPPALPTEFPSCTAKVLQIHMTAIDSMKARLIGHTPIIPTTNTLICALVWSCITRARTKRQGVETDLERQLVMAVNGRKRIDSNFSSRENPYFGNVIVYARAALPTPYLCATDEIKSLAKICNVIAESHSVTKIGALHIAEVYKFINELDDYRTVFPGWDLFNSRDLTITSWAELDMYGLDFGSGLGKPEFIRIPYTEADGVCIIMPRRKTASEIVEVTVMLRRDDMDLLHFDAWKAEENESPNNNDS